MTKPQPCRIAVVLTTHNRPERLREVLTTLRAERLLTRAVIVNNAGTPATCEVLAEFANEPRFQVVHLDYNGGSSGGVHAGLSEIQRHADWDWVIVQDDDAWPGPGALEKLAERYGARSGEKLAVAALVRQLDGRICEMNRPRRVPSIGPRSFLRVLARRGRMPLTDEELTAGPVPVDMSTFVGLFMTRPALLATGLPDPRFFIYCDDWDYTIRLRKGGTPILHDPDVPYVHAITSQVDMSAPFRDLWRKYYSHRNVLVLLRHILGPLAPAAQHYWLGQWRKDCAKYPDPAKALAVVDKAARILKHPDEWLTHDQVMAWVRDLEAGIAS